MHWTILSGIMSIRGKGKEHHSQSRRYDRKPALRRAPIEHVHPYMEERFEILSGSARLSMRGQERDVGAGETVVVHAGTPRVWGNPNEDDVHLILEFRPALRMETWFETFFGLQKDGKVNPNSGLPNPFQWAVISREYENEIYLA